MVYRYESDEDAFLEYPKPGSDPSVPGAAPPPPAGPSPSRFPTPSLPPPVRSTRPAAPVGPPPAPAPPPGPAPAPAPVPAPAEPAPRAITPVPQPATGVPRPPQAAYRITEPLDLPRTRRDDRRRGGRVWQALIGGAAVLVLLALCGLAVAALLQSRTGTPQAGAPTGQPAVEQSAAADGTDLDSRDTDQLALTAKEVFPGRQLVVTDGQPAYDVLRTNSSGSCAVAASGEIADLLVRLGCNQVVRATLRSPDGKYLLTTGLFNLTDVASAQRARDRIRQLLDERQGRFRGMTAGDGTEAVANAAARVGWQVRGHYIAYCLVTRSDGERVASTDAKAREVLYDLIEVHLNRGVLERRANGGVASQPTGAPTDGVTGQDGTGS